MIIMIEEEISYPVINKEICKGCMRCIVGCPQNAILLSEEIIKLNDRDRQIIELRYGLNGKDEYTQKEVAEMLCISQSYISRIEKKVIKKLKSIIKN